MSKYKVGDKIILTVTSTNEMGCLPCYVLNDDLILSKQDIDKYSEPLTTYTEPLEAKIRRQAAEITRLLAENKELKEDFEKSKLVSLNAGQLAGQNEAWELARKIILRQSEGGMNDEDYKKIFGNGFSEIYVIKNYTYTEVAAKVAEWERAKKEVKVGDVLEGIYDSNIKCVATNLYPSNMAYLVFDDGTTGICNLNDFKKTGRRIDIDSFLKQIRGEQE